MNITLNTRPESFNADQLSVAEIIRIKNYTFKMLITKINGQVVKTDDREAAMVSDGDVLEVIHLISGG
ncbi:MAG: sulfur carrier protein ThiS [Bacteroidales bacterium]|jgi:thiamine biosynthesis protein ThiS|nr:sulfur carrier protein ThiS [Bacteroidales bacterium]